MTHRFRLERDSMGDMQVPVSALYGASTQRAVLNFPVSELRLQRAFIRALALIKACAAEVNAENGDLHEMTAAAISLAATRVSQGTYDDQFVVDVFQTGSGTSTNMNANEVIANLSIEILGGTRGDRTLVHPNDHVNMGMSSNDAVPTATHIAAAVELTYNLLPVLDQLQNALEAKAAQFAGVIKTGRTHLNDATPITLGQEFHGYAGQIERAIARIASARDRLCEVALGGTAVGTGINTRSDFAARVLSKVSTHIGINVHETGNHFQAQSTLDEVVYCAGTLKVLAATLMKIANDIRFLGSGPRVGFGELALPEVQPGSSIMPGKVNPVIAESVCQVAAQVYGNEAAIGLAGQSGNFELNVMQPVAAYNLLQAIELLAHACDNFRRQCIIGLTATAAGPKGVEEGLALCTALVPVIGYDQAAKLAKIAHGEGRTIRAVALDHTSLTADDLARLLDPFTMIHPEAVVADTVATAETADKGETPAETPKSPGSDVLSFTQFKVLGKPRSSGRAYLLAITGGISTGKGVVGSAFEDFGVPVFDTDHLGHELLSSPNPVYDAVLKRFNGAGDLVSFPGQAINRKRLGAKVFGKPEELAALNAIMHPAILNLLDERLAQFGAHDIVAVQVPLLHETGLAALFDESWAVITTDALQLKWLMDRDHISEEAARKRIAAQLPQDEKARLCRRIIVNSGTRESTRIQVGTQLQNVYALVA